MADANIKVDPKQLKNYSNNIKTGYKNMYSYLSESKTAVKKFKIHLDRQRFCGVLQPF